MDIALDPTKPLHRQVNALTLDDAIAGALHEDWQILAMALVVMVVGGLRTLQGVLLGSLLIGLVDSVGKFFFEFGITVTVAVLISLFVSLTLTPMLTSRFLSHTVQHGRVYLFVSRTANTEPRLQIGRLGIPLFGVDVEN
jgi:Cu/Ag efflux pump CusA